MIVRLALFFVFLLPHMLDAGVSKYKLFKKNTYKASITTYEIDDMIYLNLDDMSKRIGMGKNIYSASGRIVLSYGGKRMIIRKDKIIYDEMGDVNFPQKAFIIRASQYFVLSDIFTHPNFTRLFGMRVDIDQKEKSINIYEDINITSVKYFYYIEKSRVVIYASQNLDYDVNVVGKNLIVSVKKGSYIVSKDYIVAGDGVIDDITMRQEKGDFKVIIALSSKYDRYEHFVEKEPYRIIVDVIAKSESIPKRIEGATDSTTTVILPDKIDTSVRDKYVIVIDPGHGGKDPGGKVIFGKPEKQINLEIARYLYELLKDDKKFDVKLTRNEDIFIPLYERSRIANNAKCDIFVSIHANAHNRKRDENGFEVYFLSENATDPWASEVADYENASVEYEGGVFDYTGTALVLHSIARSEYINEGGILAGYITRFMEKYTPFANRGVKQAAFYVLRGTYCPSVLIEVGFMTNYKDKKKLDTSSVQKRVAKAIYSGIVEYVKSIEKDRK